MATVFMKWLETKPEAYDRGIRWLTLGRIGVIHNWIVERFVGEGMQVLEIGCGTGELACQMAGKGAIVTAIDISPPMLALAEERIEAEGLSAQVTLQKFNATALAEFTPSEKFDLIVSSLLLSELSPNEGKLVISGARDLLKEGGKLIVVEEVMPQRLITKVGYFFARLPAALLTFLLTRTTTKALRGIESDLIQGGFDLLEKKGYLAGSLCVFVSQPSEVVGRKEVSGLVPQFKSASALRNLLIDLWALFFRIVPPYPKVTPGLYRLGSPTSDSPLLLTGNFDLSVRRVFNALEEETDAWLLVVDTSGINVWCAAGGGFFTADKVVSAMRANRVESHVHHRQLILPQLCANGVDGLRIREETGWEILWGPVHAEDLPAYLLSGFSKSDSMRTVDFPIAHRLELVSGTFGLYALVLLVPMGIFWRHLFWPALAALAGLSYFYAIALPWLPGKDGLWKAVPLSLLSLLGLFLFTVFFDPVPINTFYNRAFGIVALAIFVSAEFQGMSPRMRGEQANWIPEMLIGVGMGFVYWLVPYALGWR